jgi:flagellar FliL protein
MDDPADIGLTKAKLDDTELSDELPKALQKVELDLDDAPFLEDEKEEAPPPPPGEESVQREEETPQPPWWKKKAVVFGGAALVLVILAALAYFLFFSGKKEEIPPPPPAEETAEEASQETTAPPPLPEAKEVVVVMDPFLVEQTNEKGEAFLVSLQFSTTTTSPEFAKELSRNAVVLRDAVYYFLKNKQLVYLDDEKVAESLKQDIMSVMNQFLGDEQITNLFIEKYVVK